MEYFTEVLDRSTGDLVSVSVGDWITITELGEAHGVGKHRVRAILRHPGVLQVEGARNHQRHRLARWVVDRGWGKRIEPRHSVPFDVVGPALQQWVAARWGDAVAAVDGERREPERRAGAALQQYKVDTGRDLSIPQAIMWLAYHYPDLSQEEVASILNVTRQLVSKYHRIRASRMHRLWMLRMADPDDLMEEHRLNPGDQQLDED